jgi:hypothetical protein
MLAAARCWFRLRVKMIITAAIASQVMAAAPGPPEKIGGHRREARRAFTVPATRGKRRCHRQPYWWR